MADSDGTYLARRAQQSLAARGSATDRSARLVHGQLAAAYARRAASASGAPGETDFAVTPDTGGQGVPLLPDGESIR